MVTEKNPHLYIIAGPMVRERPPLSGGSFPNYADCGGRRSVIINRRWRYYTSTIKEAQYADPIESRRLQKPR